MNTNQPFDYTVTRKSFTFTTCPKCDGSGVRRHTFRKMAFIEDCPHCEGTGLKTFVINEEVSLITVLKELLILK